MMRRGASCGWVVTLPPLRGLDKFMLIDIDFQLRGKTQVMLLHRSTSGRNSRHACAVVSATCLFRCVCRAACSSRYTNRQMMVPMPSVVRLSGTEKRHL